VLRRLQRGDTLIEVLFAFAVLSLVIVGALAIMNQGSIASQKALETTLVRDEIDAQATTLRFLHDAYVAAYQDDKTYAATTPAGQWRIMSDKITNAKASAFGGNETCTRPAKSFILNTTTAKYTDDANVFAQADTYAKLSYTGAALTTAQGIWIEGQRGDLDNSTNKDNTQYIDFHIRACWNGPGQGPPMTLGTIVRLYEPRN